VSLAGGIFDVWNGVLGISKIVTAESLPTQGGLGMDRDYVAFGFAYGHRSPSDPQAS